MYTHNLKIEIYEVYNRYEVILIKHFFFFLSLSLLLLPLHPHEVAHVNNLVSITIYFSTCPFNYIKAFANIVGLWFSVGENKSTVCFVLHLVFLTQNIMKIHVYNIV